MSDLNVGDFVTIGRNRLTWEIEELRPGHKDFFGLPRGSAILVSGASGRRRVEWLDNLTLHTTRAKAEATRSRHPAGSAISH